MIKDVVVTLVLLLTVIGAGLIILLIPAWPDHHDMAGENDELQAQWDALNQEQHLDLAFSQARAQMRNEALRQMGRPRP